MGQIISFLLVVAGICLLIAGIQSADSITSHISKFFTGTPTDKTVWLLILGIVLFVIGLGRSQRRLDA